MDYTNQRHQKIWAQARIFHEAYDPELLSRLALSGYRARVERAVVMSVEAVDWICRMHITPWITEAEVGDKNARLSDSIVKFKQQIECLSGDVKCTGYVVTW